MISINGSTADASPNRPSDVAASRATSALRSCRVTRSALTAATFCDLPIAVAAFARSVADGDANSFTTCGTTASTAGAAATGCALTGVSATTGLLATGLATGGTAVYFFSVVVVFFDVLDLRGMTSSFVN